MLFLLANETRVTFEEIVKDIRSDYQTLWQLYQQLVVKMRDKNSVDPQTRLFISDVFLDKGEEIFGKMMILARSVNLGSDALQSGSALLSLNKFAMETLAFSTFLAQTHLSTIVTYIESYCKALEFDMTYIRTKFHALGWNPQQKISIAQLVSEKRKKYITARESIQKALKALEENRLEDVFTNLRSAMDLALKERFGFAKINPMKRFFEDADKYNFPLPSYDLAYKYFDEGSVRIHSGKIHTSFDAREAIRYVSNFVDQLDLINVTQGQIEDFKRQSTSVQ